MRKSNAVSQEIRWTDAGHRWDSSLTQNDCPARQRDAAHQRPVARDAVQHPGAARGGMPLRRPVRGHGSGGDRGDQPGRGAGVVRGKGRAGAGGDPREPEDAEDRAGVCGGGARYGGAAGAAGEGGGEDGGECWIWSISTRRGRPRRSTRRRCNCWAARGGGLCLRRGAGGRGAQQQAPAGGAVRGVGADADAEAGGRGAELSMRRRCGAKDGQNPPPVCAPVRRSTAKATSLSVQVPAEAVERGSSVRIRSDAGDADAFPTEAGGLPGEAFPAPRDDGVEADEDEQAVLGERENLATGLSGMWVERSGDAVSMR